LEEITLKVLVHIQLMLAGWTERAPEEEMKSSFFNIMITENTVVIVTLQVAFFPFEKIRPCLLEFISVAYQLWNNIFYSQRISFSRLMSHINHQSNMSQEKTLNLLKHFESQIHRKGAGG
jgi:hypothetical protein